MGVEDRSLLCLIQSKVRSWVVDLPWVSGCESWMATGDSDLTVCRNCQTCLMASGGSCLCRSCGQVFCEKCICSPSDIGSESLRYRVEDETFLPKFCKFCSETVSPESSVSEGYSKKPDCSVSAFEKPTESEMGKCASINLSCSTTRKFVEDERDSSKYLLSDLSPCSVFSQDVSDLETSSFSTSTEFYSFKSSPWPSPTRPEQQMEPHRVSSKPNLLVPEHADFSRTPRSEAGDLIESPGVYYENNNLTFQKLKIRDVQKPFDLDNNSLVWLPPPAKYEADESKSDVFTNEDDDDNTEGIGTIFKSCSFESDASLTNQKHSDTPMELKKASVYRDFKALVFHFLKVEGICVTSENQEQSWLDIVSSLAWQASNYVRPNTSKGGSMDPGEYVKVKCVLSGSPHNSTLVKGVVCTRNLKHKRMITQHTKPKVLILGGTLEYQSISDKFASINTVLEQETNQLKTTFSKIEVHKPNIVLVEKSVSPHVVEYMLAKGISLVSNVKRSLLERIARCTGARITDLVEDIPSARLGQCEAFHMERVFEECAGSPSSKKLNKTLMFFDGCPRRLGCTVLLKGACLDELKKVKRAVQYASFAAYHLCLETSFLADEGSRFPEVSMSISSVSQETKMIVGDSSPAPSKSSIYVDMNLPEDGESCYPRDHGLPSPNVQLLYISEEVEMESLLRYDNDSPDVTRDIVSYGAEREMFRDRCNESDECSDLSSDAKENEMKLRSDCVDEDIVSNKNNQSILVSFSKSCVRKGTTCEKPILFRIKFYGNFDKPLGKYLSDYVFDEMPCQTCKELSDAHVMCYTHQHGNLTISVKRLQCTILPGGTDGNIWMWHRCLRCSHDNGLPPAGRRVKMSDAARGLSFGKFLELSFSSQSTADRVANCGHSLQRDCLRFYGLGRMVACFRYSPVDILLVHLPPSTLEFSSQNQEWLRREATEVSCKIDTLFMEVFDLLYTMEQKITSYEYEPTRATLLRDIIDLKDLLRRERNEYDIKLNLHLENWHTDEKALSILELNGIRRSLLIDSYTWDHRIFLLDSMLKEKISSSEIDLRRAGGAKLERCSEIPHEESLDCSIENDDEKSLEDIEYFGEGGLSRENPERSVSSLSDTIDLAWTGSRQSIQTQISINPEPRLDGLHCKRLMSPVRVYSFDSALRSRERTQRLCPASSLSFTVNASDACEGPGSTYKTTVPNIRRVYSQSSPSDAQTPKFLLGHTPSFISSTPDIASDGARLLLPESVYSNIFVAVHDKEPSSVVSYAISSKEHADFVALVSEQQSGWTGSEKVKDDPLEKQIGSPVSAQQSNSGKDTDNQSRLHGFDEALRSRGSFPSEKKQHHFRFSVDDESSFPTDQVKFSVICYFARSFYDLRKKCCPKEVNFIGSLSRCRKWSAQGGKSNAYFAKTFDDRFIIKQVTKTELDAFEEFAPQYFDYLTESIESGSPTCLAKILGIYQVNVKHSKVGKEEKMDFVVMENIFFGRSVSRVYDLKGSLRSRYVPDTTGSNKVLLDLNLLETLRTNPLFLGSKAKRRLERAVWNDTSFLASVDVMDYSLLVGVDNKRKQLVIGIIDFMRQYTWDKQLETWVKASGILGGSKNESPTVVSPDIYKKRFRKAMSSYFLTLPDL